jgi:predicted ATPase
VAEPQFVARERELTELQLSLDRALAGQGQVCFVTGEAGSGKTALVREFARRAQQAHPNLLVALGNCNAQTGLGDPYLPFRDVLGLLFGDVEDKLAQNSITAENANRLQSFLVDSGEVLVEIAPDVVGALVPGSKLLGVLGKAVAEKFGWMDRLQSLVRHKEQGYPEGAIDPKHIVEQYTRALTALAERQPLIVVLDDLQWADGASVSLLFHLGRQIAHSRVLLIGCYRPADVALGRRGERHPLESVVNELTRYHGDIAVDLNAAAEHECRDFVDALLDTEPNLLGEAFRRTLFQRTGGHALFTIELLRDMEERGDLRRDEAGRWIEGPSLDWDELPAKVESVIQERLDRLDEALREALTVASVEGVEFTAEAVAQVQRVDPRTLVRRLSRKAEQIHHLVRDLGVRHVESQRLSLYHFWHSLFQSYLYHTLGEAERVYLHEDIGRALEALYGAQAGQIALQLARHFEQAGVADKAIDYLLQAGNRAIRLSANEEAIGHLNKGLGLLPGLPDDSERIQQELSLLLTLGPALTATKGYAAPEVEQTYSRARELCEQMGETPQLLSVLSVLCAYHLVRGDLQGVYPLAKQLLDRSQRAQDLAHQVGAHFALGASLSFGGEFESAREHLEQSFAHYDPQQHHHLFYLIGQDPGLFALAYLTYTDWLLGYPDQGLRRSQEALALARELAQPYCLAFTYCLSAVHHYFRREEQTVRELAEAALTVSTEHGFAQWIAHGNFLRCWALTQQGEGGEEDCARMGQAMDAWRATGAELARPYFLLLLAEIHGKLGQADEALNLLTEALTVANNTGEHWMLAELYRVKGELLLAQSEGAAVAEAEACFHQAIEVARGQSARSLELRAVMSLTRLWQKQGNREKGWQMLQEIYGWFTEGFDTADLQEAKALLEELASS